MEIIIFFGTVGFSIHVGMSSSRQFQLRYHPRLHHKCGITSVGFPFDADSGVYLGETFFWGSQGICTIPPSSDQPSVKVKRNPEPEVSFCPGMATVPGGAKDVSGDCR